MASNPLSFTVADAVLSRLQQHGVRFVFGYPGGQMTPLYDALARSKDVRHILARHEQAAAFMADGYARASGRPGVSFAVCGPGVLNAATPLATAFTDSIPFLLISGQVMSGGKGLRTGFYHENAQMQACASLTKAQLRIEEPRQVVPLVDKAFREMTTGRPGPVLLEVPVDVLRTDSPRESVTPPEPANPPCCPQIDDLKRLRILLESWKRPLLLVGGGVVLSGAEDLVRQLAERLQAPVFHSLNGKCVLPTDHPLLAGLPWKQATSDLSNMESFMSPLFEQADGVLALGCRMTQATTGSWVLKLPALAQIDIDPAELGRHYPTELGIAADIKATLEALLPDLPLRKTWVSVQRRQARRFQGLDLQNILRNNLPADAILVGDITRLSYQMLAEFPITQPRTFLHPAGYVSMGYGVPAALGAKAAFPKRTVVAIEGDGCFQMCAMELATAVQEKLPIIIIVLNDRCLTLIKAIQERRYESRFCGVDLHNPDFCRLAAAFGVRAWPVDSDETFEAAIQDAVALQEPALIEVNLA